MTPVEQVIRPIVEGQIKAFFNDHPDAAGDGSWSKAKKSPVEKLKNSIAKRIIGELLCEQTRTRLISALGSGNGG